MAVSKYYLKELEKKYGKLRHRHIERRIRLRTRVREGVNTENEWGEYVDLSYLLHKSKMNDKRFRNKVWAGEI